MFSPARTAIRSSCWGRPSTMLSVLRTKTSLQTSSNISQATKVASLSITRLHSPFSAYIFSRGYKNLAPDSAKVPLSTQPKPPPAPDPEHPTQSEQRKKDWRIIWKLMENVWPRNDWGTRGRVLFGLSLLVAGKVRDWPWTCHGITH